MPKHHTLVEIPSDLYKKFDFAKVMLPPKPLTPVALNADQYPSAVVDLDWKVGGYLENRQGMYSSELYKSTRYIHLGIDIWAQPGSPVFAIADGIILGAKDNDNHLDYGPTVIIEHIVNDIKFYAIYGHLSRTSILGLKSGQSIRKGEHLADLGDESENGGWVPHLHFGLGVDKPDQIDMPGVCAPSDVEAYRILYPDPRFVFGPLY